MPRGLVQLLSHDSPQAEPPCGAVKSRSNPEEAFHSSHRELSRFTSETQNGATVLSKAAADPLRAALLALVASGAF
jgi:hypothetical protein